jgi:hypothetical protein
MHKGHYSDSYYVLARFLGGFARSIATISIVVRLYVKLILIPGLTIFKTIPWDVTLLRWYIYLGLYTHKVGWPSDMY